MDYTKLNDLRIFCPDSEKSFEDFLVNKKKILIAINAEKILNANDKLKNIINENIGYPDGFGAVIGMKKKGYKHAFKIPGCKLWLDIIKAHYLDKTFYIIGSKKHVLDKAVAKLKVEFKGINILNYRDGYIKSKNEKDELFKDILIKKPDIVFVAMGSPNQEFFMDELFEIHPALYQGLGGSIDGYTGHVKLATKWWRDNNLEWLFRLIHQPKRIFRQIKLLRFIILLYLNKL